MKVKILSTDRIVNTKDSDLSFKNTNQSIRYDSYKPSGLWYGFGSSWLDWVASEMPERKYKHLYKIEVNPSKLLVLNNERKVKLFAINFGLNKEKWEWTTEINWELVAKKYSGVEFNPYFYSLRLKPTMVGWYSGIDVASGCVWNKDAIKKIVKLI